jgi:RNA polymerase sigma-70 factor (ECF subfamily)
MNQEKVKKFLTPELYEKYYRILCLKIEKLTENTSKTHDLVQEGFMHAMRKIDKYEPNKSSFGTFLYIVAYNYIIDILRGETCKTKHLTIKHFNDEFEGTNGDILTFITEPTNEIETENEQEKEKQEIKDKILKNIINDFSYPKKDMIEMYMHDYKYHEMAEDLNVPVGTIKGTLCRAKRELKNKVKKEFEKANIQC